MHILGILGRGIQKITDVGPWVLTEDLEVLEENGGHAIIRKPVDDSNPNCVIGGGEFNLLAGMELYQQQGSRFVVCAYGHRARYLKEADAPSESVVMSREFQRVCELRGLSKPDLVIWPSKKDLEGVSNTYVEIQNVLNLALEKECYEIGIVSITVQLPRAKVFAEAHLRKLDPKGKLNVKFFASEDILTTLSPRVYAPRVLNLFSSEAFRRNACREGSGTRDFLVGGEWGYEAWRPPHASFNAQEK